MIQTEIYQNLDDFVTCIQFVYAFSVMAIKSVKMF